MTVTMKEERREKLKESFNALPRGARMAAAHDIGIAPTFVSSVLNGKMDREDLMTQLEQWVSSATAEDVANRRDQTSSRIAGVWAALSGATENDPRATCDAHELYDFYIEKAREQGQRPLSFAQFLTTLRGRYPLARVGDDTHLAGVRFKEQR